MSVINGTASAETLNGTADADTINGLGGDDTLVGNAGADSLDGGTGADRMVGGAGNDSYYVDDGGDTVREISSDSTDVDTVITGLATYTLGSYVENLTLTLATGVTGYGNTLANLLIGAAGDDLLDGKTGADILQGGAGNDTYYVDDAGDGVVEASGKGTDTVIASLSAYTLGGNIENLTLTLASGATGSGNTLANTIIGTHGADILHGYDGNDTLYGDPGIGGVDGVDSLFGDAGNDTLYGGADSDVLAGGVGNDTYHIHDHNNAVNESAGEGTDKVVIDYFDAAAFYLESNVENLDVLDSDGGPSALYGNDLNNHITDDAIVGVDIHGQAGNDTIEVSKADPARLYGDEGNDILKMGDTGDLDGGVGRDTMYGGTGDCTYYVDNVGDVVIASGAQFSNSADTIKTTLAAYTLGANLENLEFVYTGTPVAATGTGNELNNHISGATGGVSNDTLSGLDGNDTLDGKAGQDTMVGGTGDDTYYVDDAGDVVTEASGGGIDTVNASLGSYTLGTNVENLILTAAGGALGTGNALNNTITGGAGSDTLDGSTGADTMQGGLGNEIYHVDNLGDVVIELPGGGTDMVTTTLSTYSLGANVENLALENAAGASGFGNSLNNLIFGASGADTLDGSTGADTLRGGGGNDTYYVDNTGDVIVEEPFGGTDVVRSSVTYTLSANVETLILVGVSPLNGTGSADANTLTGTAAANTLSGMAGNDMLNGLDGNDTLDGGTGQDTMVGGNGDDHYRVDDASDVVTEASGGGLDTVDSSAGSYTLSANVENLVLSAAGGAFGTGNALNNTLTGGAGNDTLDGSTGADTMIGGLGNEIYHVDNAGDVVTELSGGGTDMVMTSLGSYVLGANLENLVLTSNAGATGIGNGLSNLMFGGFGADTLDGSTGADEMRGGGGNDTYYVDNAGDVVVEDAAAGTDVVRSTVTYTLAVNVETLILGGATALNGTGNADANTLTGNAAANMLSGLNGDDTLNGLAGADTLRGGAGNDTYYVDNAGDVIVEDASNGTDLVHSTATYTLSSHVENLTLDGASAIDATGNGANNRLTGNSGANTLSGLAGDDRLAGGGGNDRLLSGAGNDSFVFGPGSGHDTADYKDGLDQINVAAYGYHSFAEMLAGGGGIASINGGADTRVSFSAGNFVDLIGTAAGDVHGASSDFIYAS